MASCLVGREDGLFDVYDEGEKVAGPLPKAQASATAGRYDLDVAAAMSRGESHKDYQRSITLAQHDRHERALAAIRKALRRVFDASTVEAKMRHIKPIVVANRDTLRRDRKAFAKVRSKMPPATAAN